MCLSWEGTLFKICHIFIKDRAGCHTKYRFQKNRKDHKILRFLEPSPHLLFIHLKKIVFSKETGLQTSRRSGNPVSLAQTLVWTPAARWWPCPGWGWPPSAVHYCPGAHRSQKSGVSGPGRRPAAASLRTKKLNQALAGVQQYSVPHLRNEWTKC